MSVSLKYSLSSSVALDITVHRLLLAECCFFPSKPGFPMLKIHCYPNAAFYRLSNDSQAELQGQNLSPVGIYSSVPISYTSFLICGCTTPCVAFPPFSIKYTCQSTFIRAATGSVTGRAPHAICCLLYQKSIWTRINS